MAYNDGIQVHWRFIPFKRDDLSAVVNSESTWGSNPENSITCWITEEATEIMRHNTHTQRCAGAFWLTFWVPLTHDFFLKQNSSKFLPVE